MIKAFCKLFRCRLLQLAFTMALGLIGTQTALAQVCEPNGRGSSGSLVHESWIDMGNPSSPRTQDGCMSLGSNGTFSGSWTNIYNYLARRGLGYNESQRHDQIGWFTLDYEVDYRPNCTRQGSNSYTGIYGWASDTSKPAPDDLVEYYILEAWCNYNPAMGTQPLATMNINGKGVFDVVYTTRNGWPSIKDGSSDYFAQYFSVKRDSNVGDGTNVDVTVKGTVDISEHFRYWDILGLDLGNLYEVTMVLEGYGHGEQDSNDSDPTGTGAADVTQLEFDVASTAPDQGYTGKVVDIESYVISDHSSHYATLVLRSLVGGSFPFVTVIALDGDDDNDFNEGDEENPVWVNRRDNADVTLSGNGQAKMYIAPINGVPATVDVAVYVDGVLQDVMEGVTVGVAPPAATAGNPNPNTIPDTDLPGEGITVSRLRAQGTTGEELLSLNVDGAAQRIFNLDTEFETYFAHYIYDGEVDVEFLNDDGVANGRDVRLDYIEVNGEKRETESVAENSAFYHNGSCGGAGFSEWLHCSGAVNYGEFGETHSITVRARGNAGGEHINLLIDGEQKGSWSLGTHFQEFTVDVEGDGDINIQFDNDGGQRDAIIDWVKVDDQSPRQAENMQFNTGAYANGQCGGGQYTEWLHCNGVIGFGNISENFD